MLGTFISSAQFPLVPFYTGFHNIDEPSLASSSYLDSLTMSSTEPFSNSAAPAIHLPPDLVPLADSVAWSQISQRFENATKKFILLDPNKDKFHAGYIKGNPGGEGADDALAEKLFPRPDMQRRAVLMMVAAIGGTVKMAGIEFAQYKSELKVEKDTGSVRVVGELRIKDRRETRENCFVIIYVSSRKDSFWFIPAGYLCQHPALKKKGEWLELQTVTEKGENEALEAFWQRCRESLEKALCGSPHGPGTLPP